MLSCTPRPLGHHISTQKTEFLSVTHAIADEHKPGPEPTGKGFRFIEGTRVTQSYILIAPKNGYSEQSEHSVDLMRSVQTLHIHFTVARCIVAHYLRPNHDIILITYHTHERFGNA